MPRYEFRQGTSSKFWEVTVEGTSVTTTYGKIGTAGKATTKAYPSEEAAHKDADKQAASKVKKGYVLVDGAGAGGGEAAAADADAIVGLEKENASTAEPATHFVFRTIVDYKPETGLTQAKKGVAYRVGVEPEGEQPFSEVMDALLADPRVGDLQALVVGRWNDDYDLSSGSEEAIRRLAAAKERLTALRAVYVGDISQEESEISWLEVDDVAPLLGLPALEHLRVRLGNGSAGELSSERLRSLVFQSGGLPQAIVEAVGRAHLPALEHLELWLGTDEYGGLPDPGALAPILSGKLFPKLRYLGLRNSAIADAVAAAVASAPILERLDTLDLSMGALGDAGAQALLASPAARKLKRLYLQHNFITPPVAKKLKALGPEVDARSLDAESDEYDGEVHRFISVSE